MGFRLLLSSHSSFISLRLPRGIHWRLCFCFAWLCHGHTWLRSCKHAELLGNLASLFDLRLCMAWDSATFSWDWDAESFHIAGHGSGNDSRKPVINGRLLETELCVGKNGVFNCGKEMSPVLHATGTSCLAKDDASHVDSHASRQINGFSRELGSAAPIACTSISRGDESNVSWHGNLNINGSAMANTQCILPSNGMVGHGDVSCMATGVLPIVTTCVGNGNGPFVSVSSSSEALHASRKAPQKGVMHNWKKTEHGLAAGCSEQERQQVQPSSMHHAHQQSISSSKEKIQLHAIKVKEEKGVASMSDSARAHQIDEQHSSNATGSAGSGDSFTGLHLGKRTYSPDVLKATASKSAPKPVLAPNKKARAGAAIPRCQVEGCKLDLTTAKDYHRRHKVCEQHSKAEKVVVASAEQRFCQQCSRFHGLAEFDEAKRSCRRRLAGHNERRRKPQPDPLALHARLHSAYDDWSFLHQPRLSRLPLLWQDFGDYRSAGMWPCTAATLFENHPASEYAIQGPATERQAYMKSLSQQPAISYHDKLSLLLLQSPKSMMPISTAHLPRVHQYPFEAVGGPMGDSLTLAPSSTGAGVLAGLDTTPVTRGVTRVSSDSGRALSLLSFQTRGSQAPDVLMPADPSGLANMLTLNHPQLAHNEDAIVPQHFLLQGGQHQYYHDDSVDKSMVSMALSSSQAQSSGGHLGSMVTFERDLDEYAFAHDLNRQACTHPLFALMPYPQVDDLSQGDHQQHEG